MNLFYAIPDDFSVQSLTIKGQEAEHITKVMRYSVGDSLTVTDGKGKCYTCRIRSFQKKGVLLDILNVEEKALTKPVVTLCMGIIKKRDRLEFAVEKAVELGVSKIVLFKGEHSLKGKVREERLITTAVSAMKQSLRFHLPKIFIENTMEDAVSIYGREATLVVADETKKETEEVSGPAQNYFLIVGPEGGLSNREREFLSTKQPSYYSLGEHRLRTETAAIIMVDRFMNPQQA